jgi:hypothetical protein
MVKERGGLEGDKENEQHDRGNAEDNNGERQEPDREEHFAEVESRGRADVEVEIGVVDVVKPPEKRDHVISVMPPPVSVIHEQIRGDESNPSRRL